jgi:hypothetical protein
MPDPHVYPETPSVPRRWLPPTPTFTRIEQLAAPDPTTPSTHDHPVELAPADDAFLYVLVVTDAP